MHPDTGTRSVRLRTIAREWGRIGCLGFGGPPAHIAMLRTLCVERRAWISAADFEDGIAATNLLPGPASTQLAIYTAWRLRGTAGALIGGFCFITPGLTLILILASVFLATDSPRWVHGAAAGAGAAVAAVAVHAATGLAPASWQRAGTTRSARARWIAYATAGLAAATFLGPWLVLVLVGAGLLEVRSRGTATRAHSGRLEDGLDSRMPAESDRTEPGADQTGRAAHDETVCDRPGPEETERKRFRAWPLAMTWVTGGGMAAVAWVAFKVGALSYGGGFVIIPLMQADAVDRYGWMSGAQFLNAVALGQITPGPVVQTVAVVGYAAAGLPGGLLAAAVAFAPSFVFVLAGGRHFDRLRADARVQAFLTGAGPAAIGAIAGAAIPLGLALHHLWQFAVLAAAALWLLAARRGVVSALLGAGVVGVAAAAAGLPIG
ncbi:chromate transporter [Nocardia sp. NPDC059240]|uniref:chromate transporter n=1 Tax=Nocardia sp. NPDC059240 TaxID=3346786 RepID=UPI0036C5D088